MSFDMPQMPTIPNAPAAPPVLGQQPQGKKPKPKAGQPSFLGTEATPNTANQSNKTLLGM